MTLSNIENKYSLFLCVQDQRGHRFFLFANDRKRSIQTDALFVQMYDEAFSECRLHSHGF